MEGQLNVDDLESQQYAKLLALARELGYTCKGNPKKSKVVKFIRQSVACGLVKGKENSSVTFAPDTTAAESSPEFVQPVDVAPPKRAVAANRTPGPKSASKVKKTPNFSKLHAAEFDKMKSVVDCAARRNILASSAGRTPKSAARLNNIPHPDTSQTPKAASRIPRLIVNKAKTVPLREPVRARISPSQRTATRQRQVRTILGKVRSNRRFDLLMAKRGFVCD